MVRDSRHLASRNSRRPRSTRLSRQALFAGSHRHADDVHSLKPLRALLNVELNGLVFFEGAITLPLDGFVVDKDVRPPLLGYEAVTLFRTKPLHSSSCHVPVPSSPGRSGLSTSWPVGLRLAAGRELLVVSMLHPRSAKVARHRATAKRTLAVPKNRAFSPVDKWAATSHPLRGLNTEQVEALFQDCRGRARRERAEMPSFRGRAPAARGSVRRTR